MSKWGEGRRKPAIGSLDFGSTAVRCAYLPRDGILPRDIWNSTTTAAHESRYQAGAFSSQLYLDRKGPVYLGENPDDGRIPTSSKQFFAEKPDDPQLWELVRSGIKEILNTVLKEFVKMCDSGRDNGGQYYIDEFGLSYSAHWTEAARTTYHDIFVEALGGFPSLAQHKPRIEFHQESLASAHNLFRSQSHVSQLLGTSLEPTLVVFLDFGGHTLNGCMFSVVRRDNIDEEEDEDGVESHKLSYFKVGETFAAKGGTQIWENAVTRFATEHFEHRNGVSLRPEERAEIMDAFHRKVKASTSETVEAISLPFNQITSQGKRHSILTIPQDKGAACFWEASKGPVDLACAKIREASRLSEDVRVVLSGGSGKNRIIQACVRDACRSNGVSDPYLFYQTSGGKDSWNIAFGCAIATANKMSIRQFFANGAAFGFQKSKYLGRGRGEEWESTVASALDYETSTPYDSYFTGKSKLRIICDPFLKTSRKNDRLEAKLTYDILELPAPKRGHWRFNLLLWHTEKGTTLTIRRDGLHSTSMRVINSHEYPPLSLYFDTSHNCCLIDTDVDDEGRGLVLTNEGTLKPCSAQEIKNQVKVLEQQRSYKALAFPEQPAQNPTHVMGRPPLLNSTGRPRPTSSRFALPSLRDDAENRPTLPASRDASIPRNLPSTPHSRSAGIRKRSPSPNTSSKKMRPEMRGVKPSGHLPVIPSNRAVGSPARNTPVRGTPTPSSQARGVERTPRRSMGVAADPSKRFFVPTDATVIPNTTTQGRSVEADVRSIWNVTTGLRPQP